MFAAVRTASSLTWADSQAMMCPADPVLFDCLSLLLDFLLIDRAVPR